ncbi:unnamed protein product [Linum trigynum]|uniref:Uncharacterized protein n=1 Tax=Linum trigynum TaxID=586398 RepID=A0AAV2E6Z5_9ROSI
MKSTVEVFDLETIFLLQWRYGHELSMATEEAGSVGNDGDRLDGGRFRYGYSLSPPMEHDRGVDDDDDDDGGGSW